MIAGRKGKTIEFTISFDRADFHHLAGLHKLKDNIRIQTGQREAVMLDILAGKLTLPQIQKSAFYGEMEPRLRPLSMLEQFLDSNDIIFRYNAKAHAFSLIQAEHRPYASISGRTSRRDRACIRGRCVIWYRQQEKLI